MRATNGFAVWIRLRGRIIGCCMALALMLTAAVAPSTAGAAEPKVNETYLALGDSLAFGYSLQLYHEGEVAGFEDPEMFENGYPNQLLKKLKAAAVKLGNNVRLVNDGCPGETTSGTIGTNASLLGTLNAALKESQEENGLPPVSGSSPCPYQAGWNAFKKVGIGGPLHHPYSGSQLEDAMETVRVSQNVEKKPVSSITLNIGANDELQTLGGVEAEAKAFVEGKLKKVGEAAVAAKLKKVAEEAIQAKINEQVYIKCSEKAFEKTGGNEPEFEEARQECLATEGKKLGEEYYAENQVKLEEEGKKAAEKYYGENKAKLEKEGKEAGEKYYGEHKFELGQEAEIFAGERVAEKAPALFAQINSNIAGILLALRDGGSLGLMGGKAINYNGKITFQGGYNPFGKVWVFAFEGVEFALANGGLEGPFAKESGRCGVHGATQKQEEEKIAEGCNAGAIQPGFTSLVKKLNEVEYTNVHGGFGACMSFPQKKFNPGTQEGEPKALKAWVNMLNNKQDNGKYDGPDIHPTPAGYKQLAAELYGAKAKCHKEGLPGF